MGTATITLALWSATTAVDEGWHNSLP